MDGWRIMASVVFVATAAFTLLDGAEHAQGIDMPMCPMWDDPTCIHDAWNALDADCVDYHRTGHASFLPLDGIAPSRHIIHEWWPIEGGYMPPLCSTSEPHRAVPAAARTGLFTDSYLSYVGKPRHYALAPDDPANMDAGTGHTDCFFGH